MSLCAIFIQDPFHIARLASTILAGLGWLQNVYFACKLGASDYSSLTIEGEYAVGLKHLRTEKLGIEVVAIYPVDKANQREDMEASLY